MSTRSSASAATRLVSSDKDVLFYKLDSSLSRIYRSAFCGRIWQIGWSTMRFIWMYFLCTASSTFSVKVWLSLYSDSGKWNTKTAIKTVMLLFIGNRPILGVRPIFYRQRCRTYLNRAIQTTTHSRPDTKVRNTFFGEIKRFTFAWQLWCINQFPNLWDDGVSAFSTPSGHEASRKERNLDEFLTSFP